MRMLWMFLLFASPVCSFAAGPQASFSLEDGDVNFHITRDGTEPLPLVVKFRVLINEEQQWADGETNDKGKAFFPCPPTPTCRIIFELAPDVAPVVTLTFLDKQTAVIPLVAPLASDDLPCCKVEDKPCPVTTSSTISWRSWLEQHGWWGLLLVGPLLVLVVVGCRSCCCRSCSKGSSA